MNVQILLTQNVGTRKSSGPKHSLREFRYSEAYVRAGKISGGAQPRRVEGVHGQSDPSAPAVGDVAGDGQGH